MKNWKPKLSELLVYMGEKGASDLHLSVGISPHIRVNGSIRSIDSDALTEEECYGMLYSILNEDQKEQFETEKVLDLSHQEKGEGRYRINMYMQQSSIAAAIRKLPEQIPSFKQLGLPEKFTRELADLSSGLVIIAGPVGSGKTTTLASIVQYINTTKRKHIITIEHPIEFKHVSKKGLIHQRELNTDTLNFASALKHSLREDPDVVLIGEMRDLETIASAVTLAETGHLVLATLHTSDASESISRVVDVFPAGQQTQVRVQLASSLEGVINQLLVPSEEKGRVLATEAMRVIPAIKSLIRENKIDRIYSHIQLGGKYGMYTMNQCLERLIDDQLITPEAALSKTSRPQELQKMLNQEMVNV